MTQTELIGKLGSLGLLERLDDSTKSQALLDQGVLTSLVSCKKYEKVQGIGDDFIPDSSLYNTIGSIYPLLDRKQRDDVIRAHLNQFDKLNYLAVNSNHTPNIREAMLLADITIARPLYWPGLNNEKALWEGKNSFAKLEKEIITENGLFDPTKVKSDFLVAYAIMRKDFTQFGEDYVRVANQDFLNRVVKGIVALRFAGVKEGEIENRRNRLYELLPKIIHDRIEPLRQESDWTYSGQFS